MVYFFIADGFEEVEALCPLDILRRAQIPVTTVGIGSKSVSGAHGIKIYTDICDCEYCDENPDLVFLPGGMPGTLNLKASVTVTNAIESAYKNGAFIAAICAAPSILGEMGILKGKEAICYPGFEEKLYGAKISKSRVVADGKILTAAGMGVALEFGLLIVEKLMGKAKAEEIRKGVIAD